MEICKDLLFIHKIAKIATYYWPPAGLRYDGQWKHLNKGLEDMSKVRPNSIIFADTFFLQDFLIFNEIKVPFILISAETDVTVPYLDYKNKNNDVLKLLDNPNLVKWYSINVDYKHPKLESLPLGSAKHVPYLINHDINNMHIGWAVTNHLEGISNDMVNVIKENNINLKENFINENKKLLHSRMTINNSKDCYHRYELIREKSIEQLKKNNIYLNTDLVTWKEYIEELKEYKFCLSLPGKGLDCYRTWESLTLGVYPIVLNIESLNKLYEDLPVVIINDLEEINDEFLNKKFTELSENVKNNKYNFSKLTSGYWINRIVNNFK